MIPKFIRRSLLGLMLLAASGPVLAQTAADCNRAATFPRTHYFLAGTQDLLQYPTNVTRVAVGDAGIADVDMINQRTLIVTAMQAGATSLLVWTSCSTEPDRIFLLVSDSDIGAALGGAPDLSSPHLMQVQTDIRVVEVSRTQLREAGSRLFVGSGSNTAALGSPGSLNDILMGLGGGIATGVLSPGAGFSLALGNTAGTIATIINALETSGFAYTLAETSLVALSGHSANFLAGGEFPVPVEVGGNVSISYRQFGVSLSLTPTVLGPNQIVLKVAPEVSDLDFQTAVRAGGVEVPGLRTRRTDTTISLADGESFIISGLMTTQNRAQVSRLPGLANIPILGAFFRSATHELEERELIMIVTPRLVQPIAADVQLPTPGAPYREYNPAFYDFMFREDGGFVTPQTSGRGGFSN